MESPLQSIPPEQYPARVKKCIEELQDQSATILNDLDKIQKQKEQVQSEIAKLTLELNKIAHDQASKRRFQLDLERTIFDTEKTYNTLVERQKVYEATVAAQSAPSAQSTSKSNREHKKGVTFKPKKESESQDTVTSDN